MRVRVEEGEVDGGVTVDSPAERSAVDVINASRFTDSFEQGRGPVEVENIRGRRIPEGISFRRCVD
ncbi:hypothetical protein GCM10010510_25290 [Streptomyces anandii JCM 4720]|nr:hypothetical protein GCM10010510_25290 [Streptomyces anandii JCM 4720]